jgi:hypothetical protein
MKHTILSLLTVALFIVVSVSNTASAPRPTCGPAVNGHSLMGGGQPTQWCSTDDLPIFDESAHVYSKHTTTCPIDQTPLIAGHSLPGG